METATLLFTDTQIIKYNYIENFMYGAEVGGANHLFFKNQNVLKFMTICLVDNGELQILMGGEIYTFKKNQVLFLPSWTDVSEIICSKDFHAVTISVGYEIVVDISRTNTHLKPKFPPLNGQKAVNKLIFSPEEMKIMTDDARAMIGALGNKAHHFIKELNYALFTVLITDISNCIWQYLGDGPVKTGSDISRSDEIFRQFMTLLEQNIDAESNVEFYADKLCISKQYLSLIVKKQTGISIGQVIAHTRYERGAKLLRNPAYSVQQVAMKLSFADQSAFGKFFKKFAKVSPTAYRKDVIRSLITKVEEPIKKTNEILADD